MNNSNVIEVSCIALPDGQTMWIKSATPDYIRECMKAWKEGLPKEKLELYEQAGVGVGVVMVRMLEEDYNKIPATNCISWPISIGVKR